MALSLNAVRALEQVKMGLFMLYGADYFTEDEWVKIDGLIHKGNYVFTRGPPSNILEEPLINFEESKVEMKPGFNVQIQAIESPVEKELLTVTGEQISSPTSSEHVEISSETPNETSAEASSDEEYNQTQTVGEAGHLFDISETATPVSAYVEPTRPEPKLPSNGGLSLGYTQEQLDEVKAFNAGLTKAGNKTRPKYSQESYPSPSWTENDTIPAEQLYPSPAPTEHDTRIHSWATEIGTHEPTPESPKIKSPIPNKTHLPPEVLAEEFIKVHGRKPKNLNDFYQPNNPGYKGPKRPISQASNHTSRSPKSSAKSVSKPASVFTADTVFSPGQIIVAKSSSPKKGIRMEVRTGDVVRVGKHVSGIVYFGENLRTKDRGQFAETIFQSAAEDTLVQQQRMIAARKASVSASSISGISNGLDRVEGINAAEWDQESVISRSTRAGPTTVTSSGAGLAASRYSMPMDVETQSQTPEQQDFLHGLSKEEVGRLFDEKFYQILKAQQALSLATANRTPVPTGPSRSRIAIKESLLPVKPKTSTCYFWATPGKDCRFTAEECRDLHAHIPGDPKNLRMGKPTWGAAADYVLSAGGSAGGMEMGTGKGDEKGRVKTCWYWANYEGKCNNTSETCKYLHEFTSAGVATRPIQWKKPWTRWGTESENGKEEGGEEEGESSERAWGKTDESVSAWGESSTDKYKPPHIKALEEKAKIEEMGW